ncbi:MAG: RagB/SusD family nutrient uptake outer membrane protein [Sphingobacteriaceae bacterium]|nr:RagB/SusD family nutrient uptake outer membrane protein [Sphingobacteriaceae bacterium]
MRHYIKYLFFGSLLFLANSCREALDLTPVAARTADGFLNDPKNAVEAVNACYYQLLRLQEFNENNHTHDYFFGDLTTFDSQIGSTPNDFSDLQRLTEWTMNNTNVPARTLWSVGYQGVHNANYVITSLPDATIDANLKSRLMGEAYFCRGYWYLRFATLFGNVPIVTTRLSTTDFKDAKKGTIHDAFEQAVADFKKAAELLPEKSAYSAADIGRASKGAARGFLARTLMYQIGFDKQNTHTWQEVLDETTKIINSSQYSLAANYATIFETEGENNNESIFELQATSLGNAERATDAIGSHSPTCQGVRTNNLLAGVIVWGWGYNNPTQDLVNEFEAGDPRLSSTVFGKPHNNGIVYGASFNYDIGTEWTPYHNRKAAKTPGDASGGFGWWRNGNNIRQMRYAEILLMHAEALYNTNSEGPARTYLNMIRKQSEKQHFCPRV